MDEEVEGSLGPSVVLGLVGAVVVLLLLAAGVWGVGKIISRIRENDEEQEEIVVDQDGDDVAEEGDVDIEEDDEGEITDEGESDEEIPADDQEEEVDDTSDEEDVSDEENDEDIVDEVDEGTDGSERGLVRSLEDWVANNYKFGDIEGETYEVVWGDTLWEISEARYGSGYDWVRIRDANTGDIGTLPNGSQALIVPGQVLELPE